VDSDRFHPTNRSAELRARLTDGHLESPLLLYVGRLSAEKDIERLKPILASNPKARLALVGDGPHRKALEQQFAGLPVHFAGFLHGKELAAAYASSDIFVMPSRTETLGLVVLEAMSSGVPVVAARAGGIPEMISEGVSGYLFDDEEQAIGAVRQLLSSREKRQAMGAIARAQAAQHSWESATAQLVEHYSIARAQQTIGPVPSPPPVGFRARAKRILSNSILRIIRKLLP
jgi:glycosyltransferase involved in cell wall biosynthesis